MLIHDQSAEVGKSSGKMVPDPEFSNAESELNKVHLKFLFQQTFQLIES